MTINLSQLKIAQLQSKNQRTLDKIWSTHINVQCSRQRLAVKSSAFYCPRPKRPDKVFFCIYVSCTMYTNIILVLTYKTCFALLTASSMLCNHGKIRFFFFCLWIFIHTTLIFNRVSIEIHCSFRLHTIFKTALHLQCLL